MIKPKKCKECGKSFTPKYNTLENTCSQECKVKLQYKKSAVPHNRVPLIKKPTLKTCKICKSKFTPKNVIAESFCQEYKCKVAYAMLIVEKQKIAKEKKQRQDNLVEKRVLREKLKTLGQYEAEAKTSFQKYIRMRDFELPCISCGGNDKDLWDGGHYFKAEVFSGLIFNEQNCHKQCRKCNRYLGGNEIAYRMGLINRYGKEYVELLESIANDLRFYKYTKQELIEKKIYYDSKIKDMKC